MYMVGHHYIFMNYISVVVEILYGVCYDCSTLFVAEYARSMARIKIVVDAGREE